MHRFPAGLNRDIESGISQIRDEHATAAQHAPDAYRNKKKKKQKKAYKRLESKVAPTPARGRARHM
jgi:hypothetical protein